MPSYPPSTPLPLRPSFPRASVTLAQHVADRNDPHGTRDVLPLVLSGEGDPVTNPPERFKLGDLYIDVTDGKHYRTKLSEETGEIEWALIPGHSSGGGEGSSTEAVPVFAFSRITASVSGSVARVSPLNESANYVDGSLTLAGSVTVTKREVTIGEVHAEYVGSGNQSRMLALTSAGPFTVEHAGTDTDGGGYLFNIYRVPQRVELLDASTGTPSALAYIPEGATFHYYTPDGWAEDDMTSVTESVLLDSETLYYMFKYGAVEVYGHALPGDGWEISRVFPVGYSFLAQEGTEVSAKTLGVVLPVTSGEARRFSLAVATDAAGGESVDWGSVTVRETFPGAAALAAGTTVWSVTETRPGEILVDRTPGPDGVTLTADSGRKALVSLNEDLTLKVTEVPS